MGRKKSNRVGLDEDKPVKFDPSKMKIVSDNRNAVNALTGQKAVGAAANQITLTSPEAYNLGAQVLKANLEGDSEIDMRKDAIDKAAQHIYDAQLGLLQRALENSTVAQKKQIQKAMNALPSKGDIKKQMNRFTQLEQGAEVQKLFQETHEKSGRNDLLAANNKVQLLEAASEAEFAKQVRLQELKIAQKTLTHLSHDTIAKMATTEQERGFLESLKQNLSPTQLETMAETGQIPADVVIPPVTASAQTVIDNRPFRSNPVVPDVTNPIIPAASSPVKTEVTVIKAPFKKVSDESNQSWLEPRTAKTPEQEKSDAEYRAAQEQQKKEKKKVKKKKLEEDGSFGISSKENELYWRCQ